MLLNKRPLWLDLLTENIIRDPWSNKWLSSAQSNENIKRYPNVLFTNQARSQRPLLPPTCGARLGPGGENPGDNVFNEPRFALQIINYLNSIVTPDFSWFKRVPVRKYFARFYLISWETKTPLSGLIIAMGNIYLQNQMKGKIVNSFSTRINCIIPGQPIK